MFKESTCTLILAKVLRSITCQAIEGSLFLFLEYICNNNEVRLYILLKVCETVEHETNYGPRN